MKRVFVIIILLSLFSCEVVIVEPFDPRDRIIGSYNLSEYSETYRVETTFPISIYKANGDGQSIHINNFYDVGITVTAYMRGDRIEIPFQVVDFYEITGSGRIYGNEIDFSYSVYDQIYGGHSDFCQATAW